MKASTPDELLFILCIGLLLAAPALIGVFWGAPLVAREIEAGTFRLAWTQSVTRTRWLAVKLGLVGLASMATAGPAQPHGHLVGQPDRPGRRPARRAGRDTRLQPVRAAAVRFARHRPHRRTPLFAFALGVTVGVLIRRTVPAMAVTLAVFAAVQIVMPLLVRPHLVPPVRACLGVQPGHHDLVTSGGNGGQLKVTGAVNLPGAWVLANQTVTPGGPRVHRAGPGGRA